MTPTQFKTWRKGLYRSQRAAGEALGYSTRQIAKFESGEAPVPLTARLAMAALSLGLKDFPSS